MGNYMRKRTELEEQRDDRKIVNVLAIGKA